MKAPLFVLPPKGFPARPVWVSASQITRRSGYNYQKLQKHHRHSTNSPQDIFNLWAPKGTLSMGFPAKPVFRLWFNHVQATITVLKRMTQPHKTILFRARN